MAQIVARFYDLDEAGKECREPIVLQANSRAFRDDLYKPLLWAIFNGKGVQIVNQEDDND